MYYQCKIGNFTGNSIDMPEISSRLSKLCPETHLKVWQISESAEFFAQFPSNWSMPAIRAEIQSKKYLESIAARFCLWELMQEHQVDELKLEQDERGRPFIKDSDWQVSISHSFPFAVACLSKKPHTGIDLEKKGRNIQKIAPRFLNPTELAEWHDDELMLTLAWSAKESIYKAWQKPGLSLQKEIHLLIKQDRITGQVQKLDSFPIYHEIFNDFVLTLVNH
jgi:phosphopantetheinyl transferase